MSDGIPTPTPTVDPETEPFWEATAEERLLLKRCSDCDRTYHYPRERCPECRSDATDWIDASGDGEVYSYTVTRQAGGEYADADRFVLAYVELAEGPRIMTNVVDCDADDLAVGQRVEVTFQETDSEAGYALPRFTPVE